MSSMIAASNVKAGSAHKSTWAMSPLGHIDVIAQLHPSPRPHGHTRHGRCEQIKTRAGVSTAGTEIVPPDNTGLGHHAGNKMQAATTLCQSCGGT